MSVSADFDNHAIYFPGTRVRMKGPDPRADRTVKSGRRFLTSTYTATGLNKLQRYLPAFFAGACAAGTNLCWDIILLMSNLACVSMPALCS